MKTKTSFLEKLFLIAAPAMFAVYVLICLSLEYKVDLQNIFFWIFCVISWFVFPLFLILYRYGEEKSLTYFSVVSFILLLFSFLNIRIYIAIFVIFMLVTMPGFFSFIKSKNKYYAKNISPDIRYSIPRILILLALGISLYGIKSDNIFQIVIPPLMVLASQYAENIIFVKDRNKSASAKSSNYPIFGKSFLNQHKKSEFLKSILSKTGKLMTILLSVLMALLPIALIYDSKYLHLSLPESVFVCMVLVIWLVLCEKMGLFVLAYKNSLIRSVRYVLSILAGIILFLYFYSVLCLWIFDKEPFYISEYTIFPTNIIGWALYIPVLWLYVKSWITLYLVSKKRKHAIILILVCALIGFVVAFQTVEQYRVGDKITFGSYLFYEDGSEKAIDWIILDIDPNGNALVISDYALDNVKYNENCENITWENSTIRRWLNNDFLKMAFTSEQRSMIIESYIENKGNAKSGTKGGNNTNDKLFLLSIEEVNKYFKSDNDRKAYPTPYAKLNTEDSGGSCSWWLRSPGHDQISATYSSSGGDASSYGIDVYDSDTAVRPALKINLKNLYNKKHKTKNKKDVALATTEQEKEDSNLKVQMAEAKKEIENIKKQQQETKEVVAAIATVQARTQQYKVGDKITFGSYPFYADGSEKAIDWIILDIDANNNALIISDYALDNVMSYNNVSYDKEEDIMWDKSIIRKWLNNDFLNRAFTTEQQGKIIESHIENKDNARYGTKGGNDTYDKLFLLSIDEAVRYFRNNKSRSAYPTPYARNKNNEIDKLKLYVSGYGSCMWWLRSPGEYQFLTARVYGRGGVDDSCREVFGGVAVRPALRINLESILKAQTTVSRKTTTLQYKIADKITFGSYPFYADGREREVDWIILDIDADNNALVISDYALDNVKYNEKKENITWEESTIRKWLNGTFINRAFTANQRSKIVESRISNWDVKRWGTKGGKETSDKLFLLSYEEAKRYFKNDELMIAYCTPYARSKNSVNGKLNVSYGGSCRWWLRSPGSYQDWAAVSDNFNGDFVSDDNNAVRPALWLDLSDL